MQPQVYTRIILFGRERERERERDDDDDADDIVQQTQPVFRQFTCGFIELNFIIDRVVEDGSITGALQSIMCNEI